MHQSRWTRESCLENLRRTLPPDEPDLPTLRSIVFAHATSIPFESLDPVSGVAVSLDINAIFDKLVRRRRGGYCFEQNALLAAALREVGFNVDELSARVTYNTPVGVTPPRTHVFLAVTIDGTRWLVPTFVHQVQLGDQWGDVYEFTGETMPKIDQEMGNWWTSTHPPYDFRSGVRPQAFGFCGNRG